MYNLTNIRSSGINLRKKERMIQMETTFVENLNCPKCGKSNFDSEYIPQKLYLCRTETGNGYYCNHILAYCKTCDKVQDESEFGQHGDVWECKECGAICWPLTEKKRATQKAQEKFKKMKSELDAFSRNFPF